MKSFFIALMSIVLFSVSVSGAELDRRGRGGKHRPRPSPRPASCGSVRGGGCSGGSCSLHR